MSSEPMRQMAGGQRLGELALATGVARWRLPAARARRRRWAAALPNANAAELLVRRLHPLARRTRQHLPADLLAAFQAALETEWLPASRGQEELRLAIEESGEPEREAAFLGDLVRIGSAESCHLRLRSSEAAPEACELVRGETGWSVRLVDAAGSVRLNGLALEPHQSAPLAAEDQLEIGATYCTILPGEVPQPEPPQVRLLELLAIARGNPLVALGREEDRWVETRVGDWRGFLCLPEPWIVAAYRSLGYAAPTDEVAWHNSVDASLTAFALRRLAAHVAQATATEVEVGEPRQAAALEGLVEGRGGWLAARLAIEDTRGAFATLAVWPAAWAQAQTVRGCREQLRRIPFAVRVLGGRTSLALGQLAQLEPGDVLIPDDWLPRPQRGGALAGSVLLRLQRWLRPARLVVGEAGARIELLSQGWSDVDEEEQAMTEPSDATVETASDLAEELEVMLSFELDRIAVALKDLSTWDEGTTIALERAPDGPVRILLHHAGGVRVVGRGRVVVVEGKLGIQLERWSPGPVEPSEP